MDKQAYLEERYNESLHNEIEKISKLRLGDVEDRIGTYLPDELEGKTSGMIANETAESFAIRHPFLTGIPTLGIWPGIAKENAGFSQLKQKHVIIKKQVCQI